MMYSLLSGLKPDKTTRIFVFMLHKRHKLNKLKNVKIIQTHKPLKILKMSP